MSDRQQIVNKDGEPCWDVWLLDENKNLRWMAVREGESPVSFFYNHVMTPMTVGETSHETMARLQADGTVDSTYIVMGSSIRIKLAGRNA